VSKRNLRTDKNAVKVRRNITNWFWTRKGLRQGCPLRPLLFALVIADMEEKMKKGQVGRVLIGKDRIWMLAYANDLVLSGKNEEDIEEILERHLRGKA